ncbi:MULTISPECIES: hypothetical protein [unclassified Variovorax]|uniref:hypothetical protein n=1 Tax=unclassified Variovorax TaxID=663243 RepID=UPI0025779A5C|nr:MULTISPECIES: hypothetical protein [unclassified Variovorax]MDM0088832.1 hypothetical protein [Variovorax sp. J22G40]MDM0146905.1 hypothetical protein [Variovorax sp. J2P1-31]
MKKIAFACVSLFIGCSALAHTGVPGSSNAVSLDTSALQRLMSSTGVSSPVIETANRTGSRRVGGSGRSGKGGRYVGGRR